VEASEWLDIKEDYHSQVNGPITRLRVWKEQQDWQEGPRFFEQLRQEVAFVDESVCDTQQFGSEFSAVCKSQITSGMSIREGER